MTAMARRRAAPLPSSAGRARVGPALLLLTLWACASGSPPEGARAPAGDVGAGAARGPARAVTPLVVPRFAPDDPRVGTAGFVARTTRMNREVGGTTYTLMIFAVGDVLTLGAMVRGDFDGTAEWTVGERGFSVPVRRSDRGRSDVSVTPSGPRTSMGRRLEGQHGGFDAYDWVNVDVPLADWLPDGTPVRLVFRADALDVEVPEGGGSYAASVESR